MSASGACARGRARRPFLVAIAALKGLTVEIDTFHGTDAGLYHLPTIRQFAEHVDLESYPAAQTPLYHLLFAALREGRGLRALEAPAAERGDLVRRRARPASPAPPQHSARAGQALALTLVFALSPYFFGASFTLLTDNLALLFAFVALERIDSFRDRARRPPSRVGCLALAAAVLTRQSYVWLAARGRLVPARSPSRRSEGCSGSALVARRWRRWRRSWWRGTGSCRRARTPGRAGSCGDQPGGEGLTLRPVGFTLALLGAYALVLYGPSAAAPRALPPAAVRWLGAAVAGGLLLLAVSPLTYEPNAPGRRATEAGCGRWRTVPRAGGQLPGLLRARAGRTARALAARPAGGSRVAAGGAFLAFLLAALPVRLVYQKYFDPMVLVTLALLARPPDLRRRADYAGVAVLCAAFVAYALSFAGD